MNQLSRPTAFRRSAPQSGRVRMSILLVSGLVAVAALGATWMWMQGERSAADGEVAAGPRAADRAPDAVAPSEPSTEAPASRQQSSAPSSPAARLLRVHGALVSWSEAHGGYYPQTLAALAAADEAGRRYLVEADLVDDFGRPWIYVAPSNRAPYQLHSFGRDGVPGGEGEDRDLFLADALPD